MVKARPDRYLSELRLLARLRWPENGAINIVCHGHSVPCGYFRTPIVDSLGAYPHLLRVHLAKKYPHAVINVIVSGMGGENSAEGARRFRKDVLAHHPSVVTIDYALNDRRIGLKAAGVAWKSMIALAEAARVKLILLTPSPDVKAAWKDARDPLVRHAAQIRQLAREYGLGLSDSLRAFRAFENSGNELSQAMSQPNHPNRLGHEVIARSLCKWF